MIIYYCRSTSARSIARELGIAHIVFNRNSTAHRIIPGKKVPVAVNWGCTMAKMRATKLTNVLNWDINKATSKRIAFQLLFQGGIPVPEMRLQWTAGLEGRWLARRDYLSGGEGIEILENGDEPKTRYDFIVKYIPKEYEIRLHVFNGAVIHEQFKFIDSGSNILIRNHTNGGRFSAKPLESHLSPEVSSLCRDLALKTIQTLGLAFGAVDMIITKKGKVFVLEVNTAPGLSKESGTYPAYLQAFKELFGIETSGV